MWVYEYGNMFEQVRYRAKSMLVWEAVRNARDVSGRPMAEPFMRLPPRSEYPQFYAMIEHPLDMEMIRQRIELDQVGHTTHHHHRTFVITVRIIE
jgi:hypothetical protein